MDSNSFSVPTLLKNDNTNIPKELCTLIKSVNNNASTWDEVMVGLRDYIWEKRLFDPQRMKVLCKGDALAKIIGVEEFTILEIKTLLESFVFRLRSNDVFENNPPETMCKGMPPIPFREAVKRKAEEEVIDASKGTCEGKKHCEHVECSETLSCDHLKCIASPMLLHIPPSPIQSASDCESIQNVETSVVTDSSDDDIFFEEDSINKGQFLPSGSIFTIAETFEVEFEPNSGSDFLYSDSDSSGSEWDSIMDLDSILSFVCKTDDDQEFWADIDEDLDSEISEKSSDEDFDAEISESDLWCCTSCKRLNNPKNRFCLKCFATREGWLPEKPLSEKFSHSIKRKPRSKRKKRSHKDSSKYFKDSSKSLDLPSTSQEKSPNEDFNPIKNEIYQSPCSKISDHKNSFDRKICLVCFDKPVDSCMVHGKLGHAVCCAKCAKRFKRCPVCRRTIEKVVYLIS